MLVNNRLVFFLMALMAFLIFPWEGHAETYKSKKIKPRWISNVPDVSNMPYSLEVTYVDMASSLDAARQASKKELYNKVSKRENVSVNESYDYKSLQQGSGMDIRETSEDVYSMQINSKGEAVTLSYKKIDEYWIQERHGSQSNFKLYTLYAVSRVGQAPRFENITVTNRYGAAPVIISLIPGAGQMYKGSYAKGGLILGSEVLCVASIILCENQRADYRNKVLEQPRFAKEYNTKANNWETGRNVMIGVAGALYLYNLIDAAVTGGASRAKVRPLKNTYLSVNPSVLFDRWNQPGVGVNLSLNF